jgi:hypothetical protein
VEGEREKGEIENLDELVDGDHLCAYGAIGEGVEQGGAGSDGIKEGPGIA